MRFGQSTTSQLSDSDTWLFLKNFIKNPRRNASLVPSSHVATRSILNGIDFSAIHVVVELGPGNGEFTGEILRRCLPDTLIILVEIEESYVKRLTQKYGAQVVVEHAGAHTLDEVLERHGVTHVDLLVSGLPFLPETECRALLATIRRLTDRGTIFRFFTYMPPVMTRIYRTVPVQKKSFVLANVPPLWVYGVN